MNNLLETSKEILELYHKGEQIEGYKFLQLEIAIKQYDDETTI